MAKSRRASLLTVRKRGRKRKYGRGLMGRKKQNKVKVNGVTLLPHNGSDRIDDHDSITAQTATNLKAFRYLFGSHEETEEEFQGYYKLEIFTIAATCKRRLKKIKNEIIYLESFLSKAHRGTATESIQGDSVPIPNASQSSPSSIAQPSVDKLAVSSISSDLNFPGFAESDCLHASCRDKACKLLEFCDLEKVGYGHSGNHNESNSTKPSSCEVSMLKNHLNSQSSIGAIQMNRVDLLPEPDAVFEDFIPTRAIGEITVTPFLQSDVPMAVKVTHSPPSLTSCLPKT